MLELIERYRHEWLKGFESAWPREYQHLFLGVTICNQEEADQKIPLLLQIPAAVRWVSIEPMLGPIIFNQDWFSDIGHIHRWGSKPLIEGVSRCKDCNVLLSNELPAYTQKSSIDWVVLGGETGPGARPMNSDWARSVRDQCQAAGVPFFFKQNGEWLYDGFSAFRVGKKAAGRILDGREWNELPEVHK